MVIMVKLSELRTADEIHEQDMRYLDYRREAERTRLANDVAIRVLRFRTGHGLSQADLARMTGMRQPNIARLESGEDEPSLSTLARLAALGLDLSITVKCSGPRTGACGVRRGTESP
jgi:ribosome-binding protein aMBF1 (putative translation factor)